MSALVVGAVPFLIPDEEPKERFKSRSSMNFSLDENFSLAVNGESMKQKSAKDELRTSECKFTR